MLVKYYFKIKYIKGTDNINVDIFNKKVKYLDILQGATTAAEYAHYLFNKEITISN